MIIGLSSRKLALLYLVGTLVNKKVKIKLYFRPNLKFSFNRNDQGNQTEKPVKIMKSLTRIGVVQQDCMANPRVQTTYQQHFNRTADLRLGYCDNRSLFERHRDFKN